MMPPQNQQLPSGPMPHLLSQIPPHMAVPVLGNPNAVGFPPLRPPFPIAPLIEMSPSLPLSPASSLPQNIPHFNGVFNGTVGAFPSPIQSRPYSNSGPNYSKQLNGRVENQFYQQQVYPTNSSINVGRPEDFNGAKRSFEGQYQLERYLFIFTSQSPEKSIFYRNTFYQSEENLAMQYNSMHIDSKGFYFEYLSLLSPLISQIANLITKIIARSDRSTQTIEKCQLNQIMHSISLRLMMALRRGQPLW
jgi:hypothetical protein